MFLIYQMNAALRNIVVGVSELKQLYEETKPQPSEVLTEPKIALFLSQIGLENFFKVEEKFTTELTAFTKKRFFEVCLLCYIS
jgi:hypothetical protein